MRSFLASLAGLALLSSPLIASAETAPAAKPATAVKAAPATKSAKPASKKTAHHTTEKKPSGRHAKKHVKLMKASPAAQKAIQK